MSVKECTRCHRRQPIEDFYRDRTKKGGRDTWCKLCCYEHAQERR